MLKIVIMRKNETSEPSLRKTKWTTKMGPVSVWDQVVTSRFSGGRQEIRSKHRGNGRASKHEAD